MIKTLYKFNFLGNKIIILVIISLMAFPLISQTKKETLSEKKLGDLECNLYQNINLETFDTTLYLSISFQNAKYNKIVDIKSIFFNVKNNDADIKELIKNLKDAYSQIGKKQQLSWNKKHYLIDLFDNSNDLYLSESSDKGTGYTLVKKYNVELLIQWLESIVSKNYNKNKYQLKVFDIGIEKIESTANITSKITGKIEISDKYVLIKKSYGYGYPAVEFYYSFISGDNENIYITDGINKYNVIINNSDVGKKKGFEYNCSITFEMKDVTFYYYSKIN